MISEERINKLAHLMLESFPDGAVRVTVSAKEEDYVVTYDVKYYSETNEEIPLTGALTDPKSEAQDRGLQILDELMEAGLDGLSPNTATIRYLYTLDKDGVWQLQLLDPKMRTIYSESRGHVSFVKKGDLGIDANGLSDPKCDHDQSSVRNNETQLTIPQLFGFIHEELSRGIPGEWDSIIVEGEVFEEDGGRAVSMVTWYTTPEEPEPVRFVPENTIGPMNALIELNKQNAPQGKPWRRVRLVYHTNGTVDVDTDTGNS